MSSFNLTHSTDTNKRKDPLLSHTTSAYLRLNIWSVKHSTDANRLKDPLLFHSTDALLTTGAPDVQPQNLTLKPQFSKNAPLYISIGGGLSAMIGLPRIATWNILGRPEKPKKGTMGLNTETKKLEVWNGSVWYDTSLARIKLTN